MPKNFYRLTSIREIEPNFFYAGATNMSNQNQSADSPEEKPKKLNLDALLPAKRSITTSIGTLYARRACSGDWKDFELADSIELGRIAIQQLCNRVEDKHDRSALHDADLKLLTDADYQDLALGVATQNRWQKLPSGSGLKELGELIKAERQMISKRHKEMLGDLQKSIASSYSFLGKSALDKLQEQMAGIANIGSSFAATDPLLASVNGVALAEEPWQKHLESIDTFDKLMEGFNTKNAAAQSELPKVYDVPRFKMPPQVEETPMGRATLESAANSRQVAKKMDDLVVVVAGLNQTLVKDVLPAWFKKIDEDQKEAKSAFDQAAHGLRWTKWAVIASVFVTIAATWWQVDVATSIDHENSEQQKRSEDLLRQQLETQKKLIEQQAKDAAAMREVVLTLKQQALVTKPNRRSGS